MRNVPDQVREQLQYCRRSDIRNILPNATSMRRVKVSGFVERLARAKIFVRDSSTARKVFKYFEIKLSSIIRSAWTVVSVLLALIDPVYAAVLYTLPNLAVLAFDTWAKFESESFWTMNEIPNNGADKSPVVYVEHTS